MVFLPLMLITPTNRSPGARHRNPPPSILRTPPCNAMPDVKGCRRAPFPARGGGIPVRGSPRFRPRGPPLRADLHRQFRAQPPFPQSTTLPPPRGHRRCIRHRYHDRRHFACRDPAQGHDRGGGARRLLPSFVRLGPLQEVDQRAAAHWHHGGGGFVEVPAGRLGRPTDAARGIPDNASDLMSLAQTGCCSLRLQFAPSRIILSPSPSLGARSERLFSYITQLFSNICSLASLRKDAIGRDSSTRCNILPARRQKGR